MNPFYQYQCKAMHINFIPGKVDSDNTQTLVTARDRGGLWKVNELIATIFLECEKIFRSFTSQFQPELKCSDLVQKIQTNSGVISNFNSLYYYIE